MPPKMPGVIRLLNGTAHCKAQQTNTLMDLVIQGQSIDQTDLNTLTAFAGNPQIKKIAAHVYRLTNATITQKNNITEYCIKKNLDHAWVSPDLSLKDYGLVAIDMDSTLITIECIDEIADMCGVKEQVADITQRTMQGEIDFTESLQQRTALLKNLPVSALQTVYDQRLTFSPGAAVLIKKMQAAGVKTMVVSGGFTFFTDRIQKALGMDFAFANTLEINAGLLTGTVNGTIIDAQGKAELVKQTCQQLGLSKQQVIAIGDGANDLKMMAEVDISIAYHAKPIVQEYATHAINHVGLDGIIHLFT